MSSNSKEYARAYYAAHKEQIAAYQRAYQKKKRKAQAKADPWLLDSRIDYKTPTREDFQAIPQAKSYNKEYYEANKERIREQQRASRLKKKRLQKQRDYYAANREHLCELQRKSYAKRQQKKRMERTWYGRTALKIKSLFKSLAF